MPRMSKKRKAEWSFFLDEKGRITNHALCRRCANACKQSSRADVIHCPKYRSKRAVKEEVRD